LFPTFVWYLHVWDSIALGYLVPTFGAHRVLSQRQPPFDQPPTQTLPTITEAAEHLAFDNIPEVQLQQANVSTTATGTNQNGRGASSTQTNGGDQHQSPPRAPLPLQLIQGDLDLDQIKVQDWDEAVEDEAIAKEDKLIRVR
jgi:hypothetical protein